MGKRSVISRRHRSATLATAATILVAAVAASIVWDDSYAHEHLPSTRGRSNVVEGYTLNYTPGHGSTRNEDRRELLIAPLDGSVAFGGQVPVPRDVAATLVRSPDTFFGSSQLVDGSHQGQPAVRVVTLDPLCVAARIGIEHGDLILYLNGVPARTGYELVRPRTWADFAEYGVGVVFLIRGSRAVSIDYAAPDWTDEDSSPRGAHAGSSASRARP